MNDVLGIMQNVAKFAFRDQGRWEELRNLFHPNAAIAVTWYSGPIEGFIERSAKMAAADRPHRSIASALQGLQSRETEPSATPTSRSLRARKLAPSKST
jgi:hypothetical protein